MIDIEKVGKKFEFPTIDFKFQNTGDATAVLWEFQIAVLEASIDRTPVLSGRYLCPGVKETEWNRSYWSTLFDSSGNLTILLKNDGWGAARNCRLAVRNPLLERIFTDDELRFEGDIESREERTLTLKAKLLEEELFDNFEEEDRKLSASERHRSGHDEWYWVRMRSMPPDMPPEGSGIRLHELAVHGAARDASGIEREIHVVLQPPTKHGELLLQKDRFLWWEGESPRYAPLRSAVIYSTIIDVDQGPHNRTYRISRKIPPGDVERFHVMIGASKSCQLKLKFCFRVDEKDQVKSGVFSVQIWNPANKSYHLRYPDGEEMNRTLGDLYRKQSRGELNEESYLLQRLRDHSRELRNVPFIDEKPRTDDW